MIKFKQQKELNEGMTINMMPLIDIIFNLLIFFMITAAITTKGINLELPEAESSEKIPSKSWEIVINEKEQIFFNESRIDLSRFKKILDAEKMKPEKTRVETIILKTHRQAPFGSFVSVMDTARQKGFYNIVIATDAKKRKSDF